ncbi:MAG: UDP-N-acetylglucosamine 2-epimerase (non-hydrolyzing) [Thermaerobacter sp.]|nr:MAG: UDP-N-acetylglucosamine 2-epimerase (non-hydrolyzing) [Bacillota bacterium]
MVVFGTRPEATKMAPVVRELERHPGMEPIVTVTAQHREMLDQVLRLFRLPVHHDLDIMRPRQSLTDVTVRVLEGLERLLEAERPDVVLVHGDTATTAAASLAAFYARVPVGHVEAGLRTYRKYEPFPEEIFRRITDAIADIHFAPTRQARDNLLAERIDGRSIFVTGNTAIDALLMTVRPDYTFRTPGLASILDGGRRVLAVEAHRRENWGRPMHDICRALRRVLDARDDVCLVYSVHRNPEVAGVVTRYLDGHPRAHLFSPPLDYDEWANLMARCAFVVTDSGGLQEEAPALGKPVLLLRNATERPEAVAAGTVQQVGTDPDAVTAAILRLLDDPEAYRAMATARNPYGDGQAARRTVQGLACWLGLSTERPDEWDG